MNVNSVTINNSIGGRLHTWLVFKTGEHFSFNPPNSKCAISCDCKGILESDEIVRSRIPYESKEFDITKKQFDRMIAKTLAFSSDGHTYALMPLEEGEYNCVKASRIVLQTGGIHFLDDVITPFGVSSKIQGSPFYLETDRIWELNGTIPRITNAVVETVSGKGLAEGRPDGRIFDWIFGVVVALGLFWLFSKMRTTY